MASMTPMFMIAFANLFAMAQGNAFLGREPEQISSDPSLLDELEKLLGKDHRDTTERRVVQLEEMLRPMYQAMPKGANGGLGPEAVRFTLHRMFVNRHGWFVRGLDVGGDTWNSSSPAAIFKKHADADVHELFEERLSRHDFSLHQLAVMGATLESMVRNETMDRLRSAYSVLSLAENDEGLKEEQVLEAIDTYMLMYVLGTNHSRVTKRHIDKYRKVIHQVYPTWEQTKKWVRDVRTQVLGSSGMSGATSFSATERVLEEMEDRYGKWQNSECQELKESLLKLEDQDTGRVRIETFYKSALDGNWQFSESIEYLRLSGALDETDLQRLSVIIPNYVNSPSNCVAGSKFYSVCCIDECQALMQQIEIKIAAPDASPGRIAEIVASMPSATTKAPRTLATSLIQRLQDISSHHGGVVPLHGRLFTQWMHHAYPRECSYPHLSGTTKPLNPVDYMTQTKQELKADLETMKWHIDVAEQLGNDTSGTQAEELPWLQEEELFVSRPEIYHQAVSRPSWHVGRGLMMFVAIGSVALTLARSVLDAGDRFEIFPKRKQHKFVV